MRKLLLGLAGLMLANAGLAQAPGACAPNLDFRVEPLGGGEPVYLCREYAGRVVLIVNTASKCAFTDQYADLEALHDRYRDKGLAVLGFPSNDFGSQEPGDADQIKSFCRLTYSVEFPMFAKSHVRAGRADPLYERLAQAAGEYPQWNFHKYLLGRDGELVASFPSHLPPDDPQVTDAIRKALAASSSPEN
jgi:glutathione peroxidase